MAELRPTAPILPGIIWHIRAFVALNTILSVMGIGCFQVLLMWRHNLREMTNKISNKSKKRKIHESYNCTHKLSNLCNSTLKESIMKRHGSKNLQKVTISSEITSWSLMRHQMKLFWLSWKLKLTNGLYSPSCIHSSQRLWAYLQNIYPFLFLQNASSERPWALLKQQESKK